VATIEIEGRHSLYKLPNSHPERGGASRGLSCNETGLILGNDFPLIAPDDNLKTWYRVQDLDEINCALSTGYGFEVDLAVHLPTLHRIAKWMSEGQWGLAQITALQLRLPELPDGSADGRLWPVDDLWRFNQYHKPAGPDGGQFTSGPEDDSGSSPANTSHGDQAGTGDGTPRLSFKTTAGGPNTPFWGTQFMLSHPSKAGGYIVQRIDTKYIYGGTLSNTVAPFWEAFEVKPGAATTSYVAKHPIGGGDDVWQGVGDGQPGNHGVQVDTGTARFYEGLTTAELKARGFAIGNAGYTGGPNLLNTVNDPHLPTDRASNEVVRISRNKF